MKLVDLITFVLLIIGGLNWGFMGLADFNLVTAIFGAATMLTKVTYLLIGASALYQLYHHFCGHGAGCCSK